MDYKIRTIYLNDGKKAKNEGIAMIINGETKRKKSKRSRNNNA